MPVLPTEALHRVKKKDTAYQPPKYLAGGLGARCVLEHIYMHPIIVSALLEILW